MIGRRRSSWKRTELGIALAAGVVGDVAHRAGPVEGDERDDVAELGRLDLPEGVPHALRLELEDADRVAGAEHLVGLLVVERQVLDVELDCRASA